MNKTDLSDQLKNLFESLDVGAGAKDLTVTYDNEFYTRDHKQKLESPKATFSDDPLALSCASWRIFKDMPERRWTNLDVVKAASEDRAMAQRIRDYYNQRYTMQALKGRQLTEYQQKTAQFLSGLYHLTADELGLLYKLPYFYTEDCGIDSVVESTQSYERSLNRTHNKYVLAPVKEIFRTRKSGEIVQFWYRDQDQHAVLIQCRGTDPLLPMLRGLFSQPQIQVQSYVKFAAFDGPHEQKALKLVSWELVF